MILQTTGLNVTIGKKTIVRNVDLTLNEGDWLMLVGMNGAGKSTLLRAISCAIPSTGQLLLRGEDLRRMKPARRARLLAMLEAGGTANQFTVEQVVAMGRYAYGGGLLGRGDPDGTACIEDALQRTGIAHLRRHSMMTLSSGERQRAYLAQVICQQPSVLLLDEPASHLDLTYTRQLYELVDAWRREPGHAVISVVHDLSAARRFGTHALLLKDGSVLSQGACAEALNDDALQEAWQMDVADWMRQMASVWQP